MIDFAHLSTGEFVLCVFLMLLSFISIFICCQIYYRNFYNRRLVYNGNCSWSCVENNDYNQI